MRKILLGQQCGHSIVGLGWGPHLKPRQPFGSGPGSCLLDQGAAATSSSAVSL